MSLESLKRSNSLDKLLGEVQKENAPQEKKSYKDERLWKPEVDKSGNGYAVIRFLPACQDEDVPWVQMWSHGFKGPGGWYIENSLTTIGKDDPVSKANTALWNSGIESDKTIARDRKRKLSYYSNILVLEDSANAENEGKVFLFRYGKKIFEKITGVMNPEFKDETPLNPFDFSEGANFKIKIRQVDGYANYDKSEFAGQSKLGDDEKCETIWKKQYLLQDIVSEDKFKSYQELEARFNTVIGSDSGFEESIDVEEETVKPTGDTSETMEYFKKLAEQ